MNDRRVPTVRDRELEEDIRDKVQEIINDSQRGYVTRALFSDILERISREVESRSDNGYSKPQVIKFLKAYYADVTAVMRGQGEPVNLKPAQWLEDNKNIQA
jgi:sugar-specific transcriptional regulator TrmB